MAVNADDLKDLGYKFATFANVFKSSAEKMHDRLVSSREARSKEIDELRRERQSISNRDAQGRFRRQTADEQQRSLDINNKISELENKIQERTQRYLSKFGERMLAHQERKKIDQPYKEFTKGKTKGDMSRTDKLRAGFMKDVKSGLKSIGKKIGDFIKAPFKALAFIGDKTFKGILLGLGLLSFIKFIEGIEKATKWFGENPNFGEILISGLANLIGFFTGASEEERKQMAVDIKEFFISVGEFFRKQSASFKKISEASGFFETVRAMFEEFPILSSIIAGIGFLGALVFLKNLRILFKGMGRQRVPRVDRTNNNNNLNNNTNNRNNRTTNQNNNRTRNNLSNNIPRNTGPSKLQTLAKNAYEGIKKAGKFGLTFLRNGTPLMVPLALGSILASDDGKSTDIANQKNNLVKGGITKNVDAKAEDVFVDNLNDLGKDNLAFSNSKYNALDEKNITNALQNYFTKNFKPELELKLDKRQLVPDESTVLSETNNSLKGHIQAVDKLTDTLQNYFSKQMPDGIKVNNTSVNNTNQVSSKLDMRYFTPSKGKGPYANMLS